MFAKWLEERIEAVGRRVTSGVAVLLLTTLAVMPGVSAAAKLGVVPSVPLIQYNNGGMIMYQQADDLLKVDAFPINALIPPIGVINGTGSPAIEFVKIRANVDENGVLIGGDPNGPDLEVYGETTLTGLGTFSGTLLTGEIVNFGYYNNGVIDNYDFRFRLTGGAMASFYGTNDLGVTLTSENSTFNGIFTEDFGGQAKGNIGAVPAACVQLSKQVQTNSGTWVDADTLGDADVPSFPVPSDVQYRLVAENCGSVTLTNVSVSDVDLGIDGVAVPDLAAGEQAVLSPAPEAGEILLSALDVAGRCSAVGSHHNVASVVASVTATEQLQDSDTAVVECANPAEIDVRKQISLDEGATWLEADDLANAALADAPSPAKYRFVVENTGSVALQDFQVVDTVLQIDQTITGLLPAGETLIIDEGTIGALDVAVACDHAGEFINSVEVQSAPEGGGATVMDSNSAVLVCAGAPQIELVKEVTTDNPADGPQTWYDANAAGDLEDFYPADAWYRITVRNVGNVDLENVMVDDAVLAVSDYFVGNLAMGQEAVITSGQLSKLAVPNRCTNAGNFSNSAMVTGQSVITHTEVTDSDIAVLTCYGEPMIDLVKEISVDGQQWFDANDAASAPAVDYSAGAQYRLRVINTGDSVLTDIVVNDATLGINNVAIADLPVNGSVTLTQNASGFGALNQALVCDHAGTFLNTAQVDAVGVDSGVAVTDSDPANLVCFGPPAVELLKQISVNNGADWFDADTEQGADVPDVLYEQNHTVEYRFIVRNTGTVALRDTLVTDTTLGVSFAIPGLLAINEEVTVDSGVVEALAIDNHCDARGTKQNVASVEAASDETLSQVTDSNVAWLNCVGTPSIRIEKQIWDEDAQQFVDADDAAGAPSAYFPHGAEYRVIVTNNGTADLQDVYLNDPLLNVADYYLGDLAIGESTIVDAGELGAFQVETACDMAGEFTNVAEVDAISADDGISQVMDSNPAVLVCSEAPPVSIGNFVYEDSNFDGDQDEGEPGVPNVTVHLLDESGTIVDTMTTGPNGEYLFENKPAGTYSVRFELPPGYDSFTVADTGDDALDSDADENGDSTQSYTLQPGEQDLTVDAGLIRYASLGDTVWEDMDRDGEQDANEPGVENVTVRLYDGDDNLVAEQLTDQNGNYLFTGLVPGDYSVVFVKPNGYEFTDQDAADDALDSDADTATGATGTYNLSSGESELTVDAGLWRPASLGDTFWNDLNGNGVQDNGEPGVSGITVTLIGGGPDRVIGTADDTFATTSTDANGYYEFTGLNPAEEYQVLFSDLPANFVFTEQNAGGDDAADSDADTTIGATQIVTLVSGEHNPTLDGGMVELAGLGDTVWEDLNGNGIQDNGEPGVSGVTVTLTGGGPDGVIGTADDTSATTTTDANGYYEFTGLNPGEEYKVTFSGLPAGYVFTAQNAGGDDAADSDADPANGMTQVVTLIPGEFNDTLDAGINTKASLGDTVWNDANHNGIQDNGEAGVANVTVTLTGGGPDKVIGTADDTSATTSTAADGTYSFTGLNPGEEYQVTFSDLPAGFAFTKQDQGADDAADSDANPANGMSQVVTLASGEHNPTLDGGIVELAGLGDTVWEDLNANGIQDNGEPGVANVTVTLTGGGADGVIGTADDTSATTTTNGSGYYEFTGLNPGEEYKVTFSGLPAGYQFTGQNTGGDDSVDSDADAGTGMTQVVTLASGEFNPTLDAGIYALAAIGNLTWIDSDKDGVQNNGEQPISGVTVNLRDASGSVIATQVTNGNGEYLFDNLVPGTYSVQFGEVLGFVRTDADMGGDDAADSDANPNTGEAINTELTSGETDLTWDAGYYSTGTGESVCLPGLDFETDGNGVMLSTGQIIDDEWANLGVHVSSNSAANPVMVFNTANPTGGDTDLGAPNQDFGGPGVGNGGRAGQPGENSVPQGKVLIISEDGDSSDPDDNARGGTITFDFDQMVRVDRLTILDIDSDEGGSVKAYDGNGDLIIQVPLVNNGNNGLQYVTLNVEGVTKLEVTFSSSGALAALDYCLDDVSAAIGNRVWEDLDRDGIQDAGEPGLANVTVNLLNGGGGVVDTTTTDADGIYWFTDLVPGDYAIEVLAPNGYTVTDQNQGGNDAADSDIDTNTGRTATTTLDAGEIDSTWDAGLYVQDMVCDADIDAVSVVDLGTGQPVAGLNPIADGATLDLSSLPANVSFEAFVSGADAKSVRFVLNRDGSQEVNRVENYAPYRILGDDNAINLVEGSSYSLQTTVFDSANGQGEACGTVQIDFDVTDGGTGCECVYGVEQMTLTIIHGSSSRPADERIRVRENGLGGQVLYDSYNDGNGDPTVPTGGSFTFDLPNPGSPIVVTVQGDNHPNEYVKATFATDCDTELDTVNGNNYIKFKITDLDKDESGGNCGGGSNPAIDIRKQAEGADVRNFLAGSTVPFEIAVTNTGDVALTDVQVDDPLAAQCDSDIGNLAIGQTVTYSCEVQLGGGSATAVSKEFRDNFGDRRYDNNDGADDWAGPWVEVDGQGGGATGGNVLVGSNNKLWLDDRPNTDGKPSAARTADLSGMTTASVAFDWYTHKGVDKSDKVEAQISSDGGQSYQRLKEFKNIKGSKSGSESFDIGNWISGQTTIRFQVTKNYGGKNETFKVDNLVISAAGEVVEPPSEGFVNEACVTGMGDGQNVSDCDTSEVRIGEEPVVGTDAACMQAMGSELVRDDLGRFINTSATEAFLIGMATYQKFDEVIDNQVIFDYENVIIQPGETLEIDLDLPGCATQIDMFCGEVLMSLDGQRYNAPGNKRLLKYRHIGGQNYCGEPEPPVQCAECDGKVTDLTLKNNGSAGYIKVYQKDGTKVFGGNVAAGGEFSFTGTDKKGTLGTEIKIYRNGNMVQKIHTSCSVEIGVGSVFGDFEVVAGESRNGGAFCPVDGGGDNGGGHDNGGGDAGDGENLGGEGCTPGYWRQEQHFFAWTAPYAPDTLFSDVFENAFPGKTLLDVVKQGGGGIKALGRHSVAALLNTASNDVSYGMDSADVIAAFNSANPNGGVETLKNQLDSLNNAGCPLGNDKGASDDGDLAGASCDGLKQEAEDAKKFGRFKQESDSKASKSKYVKTKNGDGSNWDPRHDDRMEFCFKVDKAGTYKIKGGVYAPSGSDDSFFVQVGDGDIHLWDVKQNTKHDDDYVRARGAKKDLEVYLPKGEHKVKIYQREDGCGLDKLELKKVR